MQGYTSKEHVVSALQKGIRLDGRKLDEYRKIDIEVDCLTNGEGGVKVTCGDTMLFAGVKLAVGTPYSDRPKSGVMIVNAEMLPISNPDFEPGPPSIDSIETSRVIDRGIREGHVVDEEKLCITEGEAVWMINLDIVPMNTDGHLFDIGGLAGLIALYRTRLPKMDKNNVIDYKEKTTKKLPLQTMPIPITVVKIADQLLVDPTWDEWKLADARLTVTTLEDGAICAMQKGGDGPLTIDDVEKAVALAVKKGKEFRKLVEKAAK